MVKTLNSRGYCSLETLQAEAKKYFKRPEFQKLNGSAYNAAVRLGVMDLICSHMQTVKKPDDYWTIERLQADVNFQW